jgi:hypothetical protein
VAIGHRNDSFRQWPPVLRATVNQTRKISTVLLLLVLSWAVFLFHRTWPIASLCRGPSCGGRRFLSRATARFPATANSTTRPQIDFPPSSAVPTPERERERRLPCGPNREHCGAEEAWRRCRGGTTPCCRRCSPAGRSRCPTSTPSPARAPVPCASACLLLPPPSPCHFRQRRSAPSVRRNAPQAVCCFL